MRRSLLILLAAASPIAAQQQQSASSNVGVNAAQMNWQNGHNYILRAAEQTPESLYAFKPTPDVRSLGQQFAHVAGAHYLFCSMATGETLTPANDIEKTQTTKAGIVTALKASAEFCAKAYALSDADASAALNVFGRPATKLYALTMNATHSWEHYGNIVTYLRMQGLVPPSSQR